MYNFLIYTSCQFIHKWTIFNEQCISQLNLGFNPWTLHSTVQQALMSSMSWHIKKSYLFIKHKKSYLFIKTISWHVKNLLKIFVYQYLVLTNYAQTHSYAWFSLIFYCSKDYLNINKKLLSLFYIYMQCIQP